MIDSTEQMSDYIETSDLVGEVEGIKRFEVTNFNGPEVGIEVGKEYISTFWESKIGLSDFFRALFDSRFEIPLDAECWLDLDPERVSTFLEIYQTASEANIQGIRINTSQVDYSFEPFVRNKHGEELPQIGLSFVAEPNQAVL